MLIVMFNYEFFYYSNIFPQGIYFSKTNSNLALFFDAYLVDCPNKNLICNTVIMIC